MLIHKFLSFIATGLIAFSATAQAPAPTSEDGVSDKEVKIGMVNALSGPAGALGTELKNGALAYINKVNSRGGINGRKITLISLDDGYEPEKTADATSKLLQSEKVFSLFGYVGTPTSAAAVPIASKAGVPFLFPFTGAEFLRNPVNKHVFNLRASYYDETETMVERLTKDLSIKKIALFIQDDAFGEAGKAGIQRAMNERGLKVSVEVRYKRNTLDVESGLAKIKADEPEAVVFVGTYKPFAKLVKLAKKEGLKSRFLTVSFIGTADFIKEAGPEGNDVIITQVMPSPTNRSVSLVERYLNDYKGTPNYGSLEGYANALILVTALDRAGRNLSRESFIKTMEQLNTNVGGLKLAYSDKDHQGLSQVFLTRVQDGRAVPINNL